MLLCVSCQEPLTTAECQDLLDHYTEKQIDQARPSTGAQERVELKASAQSKAQLDADFAECPHLVSRGQFDCAMQAGSADQIERCLL